MSPSRRYVAQPLPGRYAAVGLRFGLRPDRAESARLDWWQSAARAGERDELALETYHVHAVLFVQALLVLGGRDDDPQYDLPGGDVDPDPERRAGVHQLGLPPTRQTLVAVVDIQGDLAGCREVAPLARHPLAAHVDGGVDVAVGQHVSGERSSTSWYVDHPRDAQVLAPVGHVVRAVATRLIAQRPESQASPTDRGRTTARVGPAPESGVGRPRRRSGRAAPMHRSGQVWCGRGATRFRARGRSPALWAWATTAPPTHPAAHPQARSPPAARPASARAQGAPRTSSHVDITSGRRALAPAARQACHRKCVTVIKDSRKPGLKAAPRPRR